MTVLNELPFLFTPIKNIGHEEKRWNGWFFQPPTISVTSSFLHGTLDTTIAHSILMHGCHLVWCL